jgi:formylglycine-generating enzyme required for sulfatase activity
MGDKNISNVAPPHTVTLTRGFWLCETAVTQALWRAVMGRNPSDFVMGRNPSDFKGAKLPVENVSWDDSQEFVAQLNELNVAPSGFRFSLPTETQWEYGCRAGSTTAYCFGDNDNQLGGYAWYDDKWAGTHPVGTKQANAWGLYDMHGNVWEWCLDWYGDYPSSAVADTSGASSGSYRVFRGGSWRSSERNCRSAIRNGLVPGYRGSDLGVRVALVPQGE